MNDSGMKNNWESIKSSFSRTVDKVAVKAEELTEKTKLELHKKALRSRLSTEYEKLGRLSYARFSDNTSQDDNESSSTKEFAIIMKRISSLEAELARSTAETSKD